jgi:hypothetical protein
MGRRLGFVATVVIVAAVLAVWFVYVAYKENGVDNTSEQRVIKQRELVDKVFDEQQFLNPDVKYRPLRILHEKVHTGIIKKIKDLGYGGLVTNVEYTPFSMYLQVPDYWNILKQNVQYAVDTLGLRVWIYDELGWPSGAAGGLVLKDRPDLEAQGLAVIIREAADGEVVRIAHPEGHGSVLSVTAYRGYEGDFNLSDSLDLQPELDVEGNLVWNAPEGMWVVFYFVQKPFYEGTHAVFNWFEQRRYPNLLEKDATLKFIEVTHEQYRQHVGDYFGKGIEAFFTDEPSLLGTYFVDEPPVKPVVRDQPNVDLPLLMTLNWGNRLLDEFKQRRGYDVLPYLPYLVKGNGEKALQVRWDYYRTLSEVLEESYFQPLEQFGEEYGVSSSGHLLLEENLYHQAVFEGNMLQLYNRMQIPGIDLLTSYPDRAKDWGVTVAKLASSAALLGGRERVMSEISSAFDSEDAGLKGRLGSVAVQYAYGVNLFNSYYQHETMSDEENRQFTDYIGRIGYLLDGGIGDTKVAVYYPIESVWAHTLPPMTLYAQDFAKEAVQLSDHFKRISLQLADNQLDFNYFDSNAILQSEIKGGSWTAPSGGRIEVLVIPDIAVIEWSVLGKLEQLADAGVQLIIVGKGPSVAETGVDSEAMRERFSKLLSHVNVKSEVKEQDIAMHVLETIQPDLELDGKHEELLYKKQQFSSSAAYLLVNTSDKPSAFKAKLAALGEQVRLWDPATGTVRRLESEQADDRIGIELELAGWQSVIVTVEQ